MPSRSMSSGRRRRGRAAKRTSMRSRGRRGPLAQSTWQGRRADRVPRGVTTTYTYDFTLNAQIIGASPLTAGSFVLAASPAGQVPIKTFLSFGGTASPTNSIFSNVSDLAFACSHQLSDIANYGKFQVMYDAYRINSVTVVMEYMNVSSPGPGAPGVSPTIYYYQDFDDSVIPVNLQNIIGKQGVQSFTPSAFQTVKAFTYRPRTNFSVEDAGGSSTTAINRPGQWLDSFTTDVDHFAGKFYIADMLAPGNSQATNAWRFTWKYNVSFRGPTACT